VTEICNSN